MKNEEQKKAPVLVRRFPFAIEAEMAQALLAEHGISSYVYDLTPDQLNSALQRLDAMIAYWNGRGVRLSYPLPGSPEYSDIDTATRVPDWANLAIITNLAKSISPSYGKTPSPETVLTAKQTFDALIAKSTMVPIREIPANKIGRAHV